MRPTQLAFTDLRVSRASRQSSPRARPRHVEALRRMLATPRINERAFGTDHSKATFRLRSLGLQHLDLKQPKDALDYLRRAAQLQVARALRQGARTQVGVGYVSIGNAQKGYAPFSARRSAKANSRRL